MNRNSKDISLSALQAWMKWIITDPRGVSDALAEPAPLVDKYQARYTEPPVSALKFIFTQPPISNLDRLGIYAEAYFSRIVESLESDFSRIHLVLGDFRFQKLVADYLKEHPSRTFNIGEVGKNLHNFILNYEDTDAIPFLAELADLEWQLIEVFYSVDDPNFDPMEVSHLSEEDWPKLTLKMTSSARALSSVWPLDEFWIMDETIDPSSIKRSEREVFFLLWSQQGPIRLSKISPLEAFVFECFKEGQNLSETLNKVDERFGNRGDFNDFASSIMELFSRWLRDGLIVGLNIR